ncbi:PAS domain S-box protein [Phormidium sp. LEGE 05292]|uniref:PAS domain S-box protein n=1 Tax=[Phormidium] sp. LEGE 05292 TaxID=767427 RepID=UPI001882BFFB|nr:PAS domain S-box protein [Phormidium sp. LEGE 05292]MBE9229827.1 PAS domain S-box protein [Phormidium sp. LEGE 05292]
MRVPLPFMPSFRALFLQRFPVNSPKIPLRWLLVIPFVLQTVGATALVGYLSYRSGQEAVEKLAYQLMKNVGLQVSLELDRYLQKAHNANRRNIAAVESGAINLQNLDRLHRYLILQHRQNEDLTTLLLGTPQGDLRLSHRVSKRDFGVTTRLKPGELPFEAAISKPSNPAINQTYSINEAGELLRHLETVKNIDVRDRPWYRQAVAKGKAGWTSPFQISSTNLLALNGYTPFYDKSGQLLGVFAVNISLNQLGEFLNHLNVGKSGEIFIIDRNGFLIANSTAETSYSVSGKPDLSGTAEPGTLAFMRRLPSEISNLIVQDSYQYLKRRFSNLATVRSPQALKFHIRGHNYFLTISPYQDKYGLDWLVVTTIPESDFMAEIQSNTRTTVLLCLLTLGLAIASGLIIAYQLTARITELNQVSQKLAEGDLTQRFPTDSSIVEVQKLAKSLNLMAEQLQQLFQRQIETEATRLCEAQFQQLATSIPGMIYTYSYQPDGTHKFEYVSSFSRNILELEPEQIIADLNLALDQIHPEDRPVHDAAVAHSAVTLEPFTFAFRNITPSGQLKWLEANSRPLRYENGTITWYGILLDISDRKAAEIALQRYERIVSATIDCIALLDRNYRYQIVNQTHLNWHNKTRSEIIGRSVSEIVGQKVFQTVIKPRLDRCLKGETIEYTAWFTLAGIGRQFLSASYIPYREADGFDLSSAEGSISGVVVSLRNITPVKYAELALRQSEQKFRGAFDTISAGMALVSPAGGFLEVNVALCQMLSYSEEELLQLRLEDIEHRDDRQADTDWIEPIFSGKISAYQVEKRFVSKQGQIIWGLMNLALMRDVQDLPLYLIVQIANISDRKQAEIARQESETRLRLALEASGAVAWERDLETDEMFFTKMVIPHTPAIMPYHQAMALVHPDDREAVDRANQQAIAQRGTFQIEHRVATSLQNPEWRWFQVNARVLTDPTGKPTRMIGMSVDITDRHQLDAMKDEFVSMVSHELRTPLTSIRGSLSLLESGVLKNKPEKAQQMLEIALNNTERLVRLVNDILNLQRLDSGRVPLIKEVCQVSDLIEQAVESVQTIADQNQLSIEWTPLSACVSASPDEIIQTVINLLGNAIKFSPPGSTIWLKAEITNNLDLRIRQKLPDWKDTIPLACILFSITDQGRGIPPDKLESIFGRFQQVEFSDSHVKGGTGLGLAICKNIVQRHQGQIWVESAIGQGSTFYFTLPIGD